MASERREVVRKLLHQRSISFGDLLNSVYEFNTDLAKWCAAVLGEEAASRIRPRYGRMFQLLSRASLSHLQGRLQPGRLEGVIASAEREIQQIPSEDHSKGFASITIDAAKIVLSRPSLVPLRILYGNMEEMYRTVFGVDEDEANGNLVAMIIDAIKDFPLSWENTTKRGAPFVIPSNRGAIDLGNINADAPTDKRPSAASKPQRPSKEQQEIAKRAFDEKLFPLTEFVGKDGKTRYLRTSPPPRGIPLPIPIRRDYHVTRPRSSKRLRDGLIFGIVVNPKTAELLFATVDGSEVFISTSKNVDMGQGHFDNDESYDVDRGAFSTMATGFPRIHTPMGVGERGGGYGTALYSSLCLASHVDWIGAVDVPYLPVNGIYDGISSMPDTRSPLADAWWNAAMMRHNLAYEVVATNAVTRESKICDVYEYSRLLASNMVIAWSPGGPPVDRFSASQVSQFSFDAKGDGKRTAPGNRKALVNVNLTDISQGVYIKLVELAIESGATKKELDDMEYRFKTQTDIAWDPKRRIPARRGTAASSGLAWVASGQTEDGLRASMERPDVYERLAQQRADLGWPFMDD